MYVEWLPRLHDYQRFLKFFLLFASPFIAFEANKLRLSFENALFLDFSPLHSYLLLNWAFFVNFFMVKFVKEVCVMNFFFWRLKVARYNGWVHKKTWICTFVLFGTRHYYGIFLSLCLFFQVQINYSFGHSLILQTTQWATIWKKVQFGGRC